MSLVDVELPLETEPLPREVAAFIARANHRIDHFTEARRSSPIPGFVPSDFESAYRTLSAIVKTGAATGSYFCEWGSGFGVVTCLAALLEFDAFGIEIEPDLVAEAEQLAERQDLPVDFACGTFLPPEAAEMATSPGEFSWLAEGGADAYEDLGLGIDDFDVIFVFPWPGEADTIEAVFHRFAAEGALLLTFDSPGEIRVRRKVRSRRPRRH